VACDRARLETLSGPARQRLSAFPRLSRGIWLRTGGSLVLGKPARPVPPPREDMSHVARPVWPVATRKSKLTARRLVITFVPTASWETDELGNWSAEKGIEAIKTHAPSAKVEDHTDAKSG
jgi:hypothetical protein